MTERAPNISYQEVAAAIETLALEGKPASTTNIRQVLARPYPGLEHRGSPNNVLELSRHYLESNSYDVVFRDSHLSTEVIGAIVAETKSHLAIFQEQYRLRFEAAESDRDQFLHECTALTRERDDLLKRIATDEKARSEEVKKLEIQLSKLGERSNRWENDCREAKAELGRVKDLMDEKIGQIAVATEQAKSAKDLRERLDNAEKKISEYFFETQNLNRELRQAMKEKAELEKKLLPSDKAQQHSGK